MRALRACLVAVSLSVSGSAFAACSGPWSWTSNNGYSGTVAAGLPDDVAAAYLATWGGVLASPVVVASDGASFTFGGSHSYVAAGTVEYVYTFTGSSCSAAPPASSAPPGMGDYAANVGLYVFVVGVCVMFGIGVMTGMKR